MQNVIGYSQWVNRSSPSPFSLGNVKYPQIFAASLSALHMLVSAQTSELFVQKLNEKCT